MAGEPLVELAGVGKTFRAAPCEGEGLVAAILARRTARTETISALAGIDFRLNPGEIVGVIGANGAGKSTLLKIVARILSPTSGTVRVRGRVTPLLSLDAGFVDDLSGRENLRLFGRAVGWPEADLPAIVEDALGFAGLPDRFPDLPVRLYSTGMRARLVFAAATRFDPDILLVDEVLTVGDAAFQEKSFARLLDLVARSSGCLVTSHALTQLRRICSKLLLLDRGRIAREGPFDEVVAWLEETARADREARTRYDVFRRPEELTADALSDLLERVCANVPESALPPMRFERAFPLDVTLSFPSALLPFTRHGVRAEPDRTTATVDLLAPPPPLAASLAAALDLSALRARGVPVVFSLALPGAPPFEPVRLLVPAPLPGDRATAGPGVARSSVPAPRLGVDYAFPAPREWPARFLLYRLLPAPVDLCAFRTVEFSLVNPDAAVDLVFALRDAEGNEAYTQAKRIAAGDHEKRIVLPLDGGFTPESAFAALRGRVRGYALSVFPHGGGAGRIDLSLPEFLGYDPTGAMLRDLEPAESLPPGEISRVGLSLSPPAPPPLDVERTFRVALGHHELGRAREALEGFLALLGRVENAEVHAFASRQCERLGRTGAALSFALHAIWLSAAGRGEPAPDRVAFAREALLREGAPLSLRALARSVAAGGGADHA